MPETTQDTDTRTILEAVIAIALIGAFLGYFTGEFWRLTVPLFVVVVVCAAALPKTEG